MHDLTFEVEKLYGEDLLLEMINPNTKDPRVHLDQVIKHDVINFEIRGSVTVDGKTMYYEVEDGNNNGTVFHRLSEKPFDIPTTRVISVPKIVPKVDTPFSRLKAKAMQEELDEIARNISYDAFVTAKSDRTTNYWKEKVDKLGGKIIYEEMEIPA